MSKINQCSSAMASRRTIVFASCLVTLLVTFTPKASHAGEWWSYVVRQGLTDVKNSDPSFDFNNGRPAPDYPLDWNTPLEDQGPLIDVEKARVPSATTFPNSFDSWSSDWYDSYQSDGVQLGHSSVIHLGLNPIDAPNPDAPGVVKVIMLWCDSSGNPSADPPPPNVTFNVNSRMTGHFSIQGLSYEILSSYTAFQSSTSHVRVHFDNGFGSPTTTSIDEYGNWGAEQKGTRQYSESVFYNSALGYHTAETPNIYIKLNWSSRLPADPSYETAPHWASCRLGVTLP